MGRKWKGDGDVNRPVMKNIAQFGNAKYYQRLGRERCYFFRLVVWRTSEK
jgi:hypothetical protein